MPPGRADSDPQTSWRCHRIDQISCGEPHGVPFQRSEIPRWIQIAAVSQRPRHFCCVSAGGFPLHHDLAPGEKVRHVTAVGNGAPADEAGPRLFELQDQIASARFHAVKTHFASAELNYPTRPAGAVLDSRRRRARKPSATNRALSTACGELWTILDSAPDSSPLSRGR